MAAFVVIVIIIAVLIAAWRRSPPVHPLMQRLISETATGFCSVGLPPHQAWSMAQQIVSSSKQELETKGGVSEDMIFFEGSGDLLSEDLEANPQVKSHFEVLARFGVSREDFRRWHNLSPLERKVLLDTDQLIMVSFFRAQQAQTGSGEIAAVATRNAYANYAWDMTTYASDHPNPPLPAELKLRVNDYRDARLARDPDTFREELCRDGGFNAHVRSRIAAGLF